VFRLKFLDSARDDIERIFRYIAVQSGSEKVGRNFVRRLTDRCRELAAAEFELGRPRPEFVPGLRSLPFGNYVLFFRYQDGWLEILNIIEGHRDMDDQFAPDTPDT
jgi:toxin ParE1/3/4